MQKVLRAAPTHANLALFNAEFQISDQFRVGCRVPLTYEPPDQTHQ
jgi:hypothetical protein